MTDLDIRLAAGDAEMTLAPGNGCRIESLRVGGTELLRQGPRYGCFPMVPWCGRIENGRFRNGVTEHQMPLNSPPHAIHGTGRDTGWKVVTVDEAGAAATLSYELSEPWPYPGLVTQTFELTEDSLAMTMGVEAYDDSFPRRPAGIRGSCATSAARTPRSTSRPRGRRSAARTTSPRGATSFPCRALGTTASACRTASRRRSPGRGSWS